jgi:hypothetical protein
VVAGAEQRVDRMLSCIYIEVTLAKGGLDVNGQAGENDRKSLQVRGHYRGHADDF